MTKQEILAPYYKQNKGGLNEWIDYSDALKAMDLFAKQQAIAFARFVISKYEPHGDNYVSIDKMDNTVYFGDELYSKFIEYQLLKQQNKP